MPVGPFPQQRTADCPARAFETGAGTDSVRVLLADDNPAILRSLATFLKGSTRMHVVEMVSSGEQALERVGALQPDLVLMDISMPGMGGLEATRRIKGRPGAPRVVVVSFNDDPAYRAAARTVGGDGFVSKAEINEELMPVIEDLFPAGTGDCA
ncbi:MAG TPA: response regulator transcription factor [Burkholderiales bacterium]